MNYRKYQVVDISIRNGIIGVVVYDGQQQSLYSVGDVLHNRNLITPLRCTCINKLYNGNTVKGYILGNYVTKGQMQLDHDTVKQLMDNSVIAPDNLKLTADKKIISVNPESNSSGQPITDKMTVEIVVINQLANNVFGAIIKNNSGTQKQVSINEVNQFKNNKNIVFVPMKCKCIGVKRNGRSPEAYRFATASGDTTELPYAVTMKLMLAGLINCVNAGIKQSEQGRVIIVKGVN